MNTRFAGLEAKMEARFERVDARFERMDSRFDTLMGKVIEIDNRLTRVEDRMGMKPYLPGRHGAFPSLEIPVPDSAK